MKTDFELSHYTNVKKLIHADSERFSNFKNKDLSISFMNFLFYLLHLYFFIFFVLINYIEICEL